MYKTTRGKNKLIVLILSLILGIQAFPMLVQAEDMQGKQTAADLAAVVEPQIRAYANSIDQKDADSSAAMDLTTHGLSGKGKTFTMAANSSMASTLLNSEVVQEGFSVLFADIIKTMQQLDMKSVPGVSMKFGWYGAKNYYSAYILTDSNEYPDNLDWMMSDVDYEGTLNSYDNSLEWMVGDCEAAVVIECIDENESEENYRVTVTFKDRFDFSTANTAGFKKFLSGVGLLLFNEYEWNCSVTFDITVPQTYSRCTHNSGTYRWTYDGEQNSMTSDSGENYVQNNAKHHSKTNADGTVQHYYELDNTIRLYYDKPWVIEYDVCQPSKIILAPVGNAVTKTYPQITHRGTSSVYLVSKDYAMAENENGSLDRYYAFNYYGIKLQGLYKFNYNSTYTYRYENVISKNGQNKIYLDIIDTETGAYCLNRIPLDDYYYYGGWMDQTDLISEENDWLSGKDIHINYFGTNSEGFKAGTFDLRIWENGKDAQPESFYSSKTVAPTCTAKGYMLHTCLACGFSYKDTYTDATGHTLGEWNIVKTPGCSETGEEQRKCSECSFVEKKTIEALGHLYKETIIASTCSEQGYTMHKCERCGDSYKDTFVDTIAHIYKEFVTEPACETTGITLYKCMKCRDQYEDGYQDAKGHEWDNGKTTEAATCTKTGIKTYTCKVCEAAKTETIAKKAHSYKDATCTKPQTCKVCKTTRGNALGHRYESDYTVDKKATLSANGSKSRHCSRCDEKAKTVSIAKIKTIKLSVTQFSYNGSAKKPSVTVKDSKGNIISASYYTVTGEKSASSVGKHTIKITFKGSYSGSKSLTYTIHPKAPSSLTVKLYGHDDVQLKWTKVKGAKGYNIYMKQGSGSFKKIKVISSASKVTYKKSNLADGVKYTFKVVPYFGTSKTESINIKSATIVTLKKVTAPTVSKVSSSEVKVTWKNIAGESGYEISYSTSKTKTGTIKTCGGSSLTSKILAVKKGKTYYYKVRAYKVVDSKKIYGPWSEVKSYKLK